jgi:hypothetical protein
MESGALAAGGGSVRLTVGRGRSGLGGVDPVAEPAGLTLAPRALSAPIVETGSADDAAVLVGSPDGLREPGLTEISEIRAGCPPEGDGLVTVAPAGAVCEPPSTVELPAGFMPLPLGPELGEEFGKDDDAGLVAAEEDAAGGIENVATAPAQGTFDPGVIAPDVPEAGFEGAVVAACGAAVLEDAVLAA